MKLRKVKIKRDKVIMLIVITGVLAFILILAALKDSNDSEALYGNRTDDIKNVQVTKSELNKIKKAVKDTNKVESISTRVQGRIIRVNITVNKDTSRDDAKQLTNTVLENIKEKEKGLYDVEVFIDKKDDNSFPIIGYRHKTREGFSWTLDR